MSKTLNEAKIKTAKQRKELPDGEHPRQLDADAAIWYRKGKRGAGVWFVRWRNRGPGANYKQAPIGAANDENDKEVEGLLNFQQAEKLAREVVEQARKAAKAVADGPLLTVRLAVETYIAERDARDSKRKGREVRSDANQRLGRYVTGTEARGKQGAIPAAPLAAVPLHILKESDLLSWRKALPETIKGTTEQRLINDLKAALNGAYSAHRERLDPMLPTIIKHGLKASRDLDVDDGEQIARDNQILSDTDVGRLIKAAQELDIEQEWDGDLYRLVVLLAATGARFSQIVRMRVGDVQRQQGRVLVPVSRKGKGGKSGSTPVPVGKDVMDALLPAITGRAAGETLLERWRHKQVANAVATWERAGRGPWQNASELLRPWHEIRAKCGLPDAIPYSLRHSSIVRGLRANLPIRLVAALHDTSAIMIERHYGRWIADGLEELAARAVVPLLPPTGDNVVAIRSGANG